MYLKRFLLVIALSNTLHGFAQAYFEDLAFSLGVGISCGDTPIGNGITFFDYNNDGWDDLTVPSQSGTPLRFFKNVNGTFQEEILITPAITYQTKQVNWVDFDNDGDNDLYVTSNVSGNKMYQNDGNFNFTDITIASGLPTANIFTYGASWGDYNNDGYLDVFLSNRDVNNVVPNYLYRNNGDGTFVNVSNLVGLLETSNLSFCSAFFDFNNDGWQDIYVSNDRVDNPNVLYKNNGDGTFSDVSQSSGTNLAIDAMTVTIGDYNHDGWFDIYVSNTPSGNVFLMNNGNETFTNIAASNGTTFNSIAWGAVFFDAENDMDLDLYVSGQLTGSNPNLRSAAFYENNGNDIYTIPTNCGFVNDTRESYSNAIGDVDNDGLSDIAVSNANYENIFIWKNQTATTNNYLKIKLHGTTSNKNGIGSVIEMSANGIKQYNYTLCGEGYLAQNSATEIFGLGTNTSADYVKVTWLSGIEDTFYNVDANQTLNITEGSGELSIDEHNFDSFLYYPNPVTNILSLKAKHPIQKITIYNMLGQHILSIAPNKGSINIPMATFQDGIYIAKLTINGVSKSIRVIKK